MPAHRDCCPSCRSELEALRREVTALRSLVQGHLGRVVQAPPPDEDLEAAVDEAMRGVEVRTSAAGLRSRIRSRLAGAPGEVRELLEQRKTREAQEREAATAREKKRQEAEVLERHFREEPMTGGRKS